MNSFASAMALSALSIAFITPVHAQTRDQSYWSGYRAGQAAMNTYAAEPVINGARVLRRHAANAAHDVYDGGRYIGSDPSMQIRSEILRDREARGY